jgi:putative tricarboxylic transport membrane protein
MRPGEVLLASSTVALGALLLVGAFDISPGAGYDRIGPRFFPLALGLALVLLGGMLLAPLMRKGRTRRAAREPDRVSPARPALVVIGFALLSTLVLLDRAGFVIACSLQFWLVARACQSRHPARDAVAAIIVSTGVYLAFSRGLGLSLPSGWLDVLF